MVRGDDDRGVPKAPGGLEPFQQVAESVVGVTGWAARACTSSSVRPTFNESQELPESTLLKTPRSSLGALYFPKDAT